MSGFADALAELRPDLIVVLGDRFEIFAAVAAALVARIPVAHLHGGEKTEGAFDEALRHSITKLSHLHFPSTQEYAARIIQMGEEPWRVTVSGAPSLDNLASVGLLSCSELERKFDLKLDYPPLLVTYHPVSLEFEDHERQIANFLGALEPIAAPVVFTMPNADTGGRALLRRIQEFVAGHPNAFYVENLGTQAYFSLMKIAAAMAGNSSSGIIEAASFQLPVVNVGNRQAGRVRERNVIDTGYAQSEIEQALRTALGPEFRASLQDLTNPYGDGHAAEVIVRRLKEQTLDDRLLTKRFHDLVPA